MSAFAKITRNKLVLLSAASVLSYKVVEATRERQQVNQLRVVRPLTTLKEATKWTSCFFPRAPAFADEGSEATKAEVGVQTEEPENKETEATEQFEADIQNQIAEMEHYRPPSHFEQMRTDEFFGDISQVADEKKVKYAYALKSRQDHLKELMDPKAEIDVLVIGGGASGAGVALEAASRGLKCAVIDKFDFASGTSSRSTKLAHGGIRYLEQMMMFQSDPVSSYRLLNEALNERNYFLQAMPYQNKELQLVIPSRSLLTTLCWYYPATLFYHAIYLRRLMSSSYDVSISGPSIKTKGQIKKIFPDMTNAHGNYGVVMREGQMNDARMNLHSLLTSSVDKFIPGMKGATLANYCEVKTLVKNEKTGKVEGAVILDTINKKEFTVKAKYVVNATGVMADKIRMMDNPEVHPRVRGSKGTHLIFKKGTLPNDFALISPTTQDGRLLFVINYMGHPMAGTTDIACDPNDYCEPTQEEIDFICNEVKPYFGEDYDFKANLQSAWAGIRPLCIKGETTEREKASEEEAYNKLSLFKKFLYFEGQMLSKLQQFLSQRKGKEGGTKRMTRGHVIEFSDSGLVSLMGGKWTSFRAMGEETIDELLKDQAAIFKQVGKDIETDPSSLKPKSEESRSQEFSYIGSYTRLEAINGMVLTPDVLYGQYRDHLIFQWNQPADIARHLVFTYGTSALRVMEMGEMNKKNGAKYGLNERIHPNYPYLKSQIAYAVKEEMAIKPNDVVCRRVPIAVVNQEAAKQVLPEVCEIMAQHLGWSYSKKEEELKEALENLKFMK